MHCRKSSSDDIVIAALRAAHWRNSARAAVTQSTISDNIQMAGVKSPTQSRDNECNEETNTNDVSSTIQTLDTLLAHVSISGEVS